MGNQYLNQNFGYPMLWWSVGRAIALTPPSAHWNRPCLATIWVCRSLRSPCPEAVLELRHVVGPNDPHERLSVGEEVVVQLLHWTSLRYIVPTGVPHMLVSLFSRTYSSFSDPRCALGLSLCRPSKTTCCLFEPFKYSHVEFAYFSFLSNPLLRQSCSPPVEFILPHASFEHSDEYHSHVPTLVLFQSIFGSRDEIERERVGARDT